MLPLKHTSQITETDISGVTHDPSGGLSTDTAIVSDVSGTRNAFLRGLVKIFADVWDSTNHWLKAQLQAGENHVGEVGTPLTTPSATFTRPADTTGYAIGDLVANSTTAASVVPLSWTAARVSGGSFQIVRVRIKRTTNSVSTLRVHFYAADPSASSGIANGDNGAWSTKESSYVGWIDVIFDKIFTDAVKGIGSPDTGGALNVKLASGVTIFGLLEARVAFSPGNAEVFTVELEVLQN